jgi:molybdopterin molybdotransferase
MMDVEQALALLTREVARKPPRRLPLEQAHGRVLASPVVSPLCVPPLDNSAMDGFAVRSADLATLPTRLAVVASTYAGDPPADPVGPGQAVRIMTGAPMPTAGADAVIKVEDTHPLEPEGGQEWVEILAGSAPGGFVRRAGEDIQRGSTVLGPGVVITAARLGLLASLGLAEVEVVRRPRVAILATGDELLRPGQPARAGQIYSSNTYSLLGLVAEAGAVPVDCGIVPDDLDATRAALRRAATADILVTSGGVSMGEKDWVRVALEAEGAQLDFWKVAVKPGKPAAFGRMGACRLFCLAGNPVSCMVGFLQWVRPVIRLMLGDPRPHLPVIDAVAGEPVPKRPGRAWLERVILERDSGGAVLARRTGSQSSGVLSSMSMAHGLLLLERDSAGLRAGEPARVMVLDWSFLHGEDASYGW